MNLSFFIAKRYLSSKKSHNAINIITFISVAGVCIGTMALVIVLSAFNGISGLVFSLYNNFDPDIKITAKEGKTFLLDSLLRKKIKSNAGILFYCEALQENALLKYSDKQVVATLKGVSNDFVKMTRLDTVVREGKFLLQSDSIHYAVTGYGIAKKLNVSFIDFVNPLEIYVPKRGKHFPLNPENAFDFGSVYVSGIFSLNDDFDYRYCILPLSFMQKLLDRKNQISSVEIGLQKNKDMNEMKNILQKMLGENFTVKTRYEQNEVLFKTINAEKWWTFLILSFILVIGTFNIIGSLTMLMIEKKKDIKTLMHLGADKTLVRKIFMKEGLLITLLGALSGIILGLFVCWLQMKFKLIPFSEGFVVDAYPVDIFPLDLLSVFCTVMFIGFFASWYSVKLLTKKFY